MPTAADPRASSVPLRSPDGDARPVRPLRICMVALRHSLDDARIVHREAQTLLALGHDVTLLFSCTEKYEYRRFDGRVLATGRPPHGETDYAGCRVVGVRRTRASGRWRTFREMVRLAATLEADVYHAHEPDLALAVAVRAGRIQGRRGKRVLVVHDMHEYPPGEAVDHLPWLLKAPAHLGLMLWDKLLSRSVDHIFTANSVVRGYALVLSQRAPVDVLYNGASLRLFPQRTPTVWTGQGPLVLCHEGSLTFDRGLREMVAAVSHLRDRVRLRIIGDVFGAEREWLDAETERLGLDGIITRSGWLPYREVGDALAECHVGAILFRECLENVLAGPPNKLFHYMNAGLPVLSVGFPELRRIVLEEGCGVLVEDQSVDAIVRGIESLLRAPGTLPAMSEAGQRAIRDRYAWERMETILGAAYGDIARRLNGV
ncbi:MAG: glycosyltransferase family 4 protein [Chloroflexi bacterium]|nr:MAG: glycosyltransferase family 4 protein [Chloroflexota bacterium]